MYLPMSRGIEPAEKGAHLLPGRGPFFPGNLRRTVSQKQALALPALPPALPQLKLLLASLRGNVWEWEAKGCLPRASGHSSSSIPSDVLWVPTTGAPRLGGEDRRLHLTQPTHGTMCLAHWQLP